MISLVTVHKSIYLASYWTSSIALVDFIFTLKQYTFTSTRKHEHEHLIEEETNQEEERKEIDGEKEQKDIHFQSLASLSLSFYLIRLLGRLVQIKKM